MTTIAVVSAGLSEPSSTRLPADRLAAAVQRAVPAETRVVNLREHAHDIADNLLTGFPPPALRTAIDTVVRSDALIAVTPIFNASHSGLFKSFFDVLDPDSLTRKPVLLGATGGPGGPGGARTRGPGQRQAIQDKGGQIRRPDPLRGTPARQTA